MSFEKDITLEQRLTQDWSLINYVTLKMKGNYT